MIQRVKVSKFCFVLKRVKTSVLFFSGKTLDDKNKTNKSSKTVSYYRGYKFGDICNYGKLNIGLNSVRTQ